MAWQFVCVLAQKEGVSSRAALSQSLYWICLMARVTCGGYGQEVEEIVIPAIEKYSRSSPHQGNSQLARAQALAAASHLETLLEESAPLEGSTPQAMAQPAANGDAEPMDTN